MKKLQSIAVPLLVLVTLAAVVLFGLRHEQLLHRLNGPGHQIKESAEALKAKPRLSIMPLGDNPRLGPDSARVKMIAFVDYQCGFCKAFVQDQLPHLQQEYIKKGKLQIIFRDYPLRFHKHANYLAQLAHANFRQGSFSSFLTEIWDFDAEHDSLAIANAFGPEGLPEQSYLQAKKEIAESKMLAGTAGITATPSVIINNRVLVGLRKLDELRSLIDYSMDHSIPNNRPLGTCAE